MMTYPKVNLPCTGIATFGKFPMCTDIDQLSADIAIFGVPWDAGVGFRPGCRMGPRAIRDFSTRFAFGERGVMVSGYWDIETKQRYLENVSFADCGDHDILYTHLEDTFDALTENIKKILTRKSFPVIIGGDHSITFPNVRAFSELGPIDVFHFDAHLDYNDDVCGVKYANGNPLKRISELPFVDRIVQVGMRGIRAREDAFSDSTDRGNLIITAAQVRQEGVDEIIARFPKGNNIFVTVDIDVLDPPIAPGTGAPCPDGLLYRELKALLQGAAGCGKVVGMDLVEVNPMIDLTGLTPAVAAMTILEFLGAVFG
jgi:agmatinase